MSTYNTKPKPRALLIDLTDEEIAESNISTIFPTHRSISASELDDVRVDEFDVVIVAEADQALQFTAQPNLIFLGGRYFSRFWPTIIGSGYEMLVHQESVATEFVIEDDLDENLANLAKNSLLPILQANSHNPILIGVRVAVPRRIDNSWQPIIKDADNNVLVGYVQRHPSHPSEQWYLPSGIGGQELEKCIRVLMQRWAASDPATFSLTGDWRDDSVWQSSNEQSIRTQIASAEEDFKKLATAHVQKIGDLEKAFEAERANADSDHRLLLTAQGTTLKNKIADVLTSLGFNVANVDDTAKKGDLLEDLQVTTTHEGKEWIALVEVRGYKRGAQLSDLLRISGRFIKRYMQENNGSTPDAAWYIVNHDVNTDPSTRQIALSGNKKEVTTFGEDDNGLVVDTTVLFQLRNAVESGALTAEEARNLLVSQIGFFKLR
jgi:hypothetical protein